MIKKIYIYIHKFSIVINFSQIYTTFGFGTRIDF